MNLFPTRYRLGRSGSRSGGRPEDGRETPRAAADSRTVRGRLWRGTKLVLGAPVAAFPLGQIVRNGRLIGGLVSDLRRGPPPPRFVPRRRDGKLDKAATAYALGLTEAQLDAWLARRRRQTAAMAYVAFGLGWVFVLAWLVRVLGLEWTGQRLWAAVQFAPFCSAFFLTAFQQAHANWQIRTGVLGSAGDYLRSDEPFWPRP